MLIEKKVAFIGMVGPNMPFDLKSQTRATYNKSLLVTSIKSNMKNRLMNLKDKILLRKRSVIETINDELKNICQIEHSGHRGTVNFLMNLLAVLVAYSFFDKKPAIRFNREELDGQLSLFF